MALIDPAGLIAFGNMSKGGGLAALFAAGADVGYAETSTGWAGLTFAAPTRIKRVAITSASNGYDASGAATPVTLRLYGKTGAAPTGPSDGVLLASLAITDPNAVVIRDLLSADQFTTFDHGWISITSGVWAIGQYIQFEALDETDLFLPTPDLTKRTTYTKRFDTELALPWTFAELPATRWKPIQIYAACSALVDIAFDFRHRGVGGYTGAVGIGLTFGRKYGATLETMIAAPWVAYDDLALSTQIASLSHHYATATRPGAIQLEPGVYQFGFAGTAHSDATSADGLACVQVEGGKGLNGARLIVSTDTVHRI